MVKAVVGANWGDEGKGKMTAGDFVRGRKISLGDILTLEP